MFPLNFIQQGKHRLYSIFLQHRHAVSKNFLPSKSNRVYTSYILFVVWEYKTLWSPLHPPSSRLHVWEVFTHQGNVNNQDLCKISIEKSTKEAQDHGKRIMVRVAISLHEDLLSHLKRHTAVWQEFIYCSSLTFFHVEGDCISRCWGIYCPLFKSNDIFWLLAAEALLSSSTEYPDFEIPPLPRGRFLGEKY